MTYLVKTILVASLPPPVQEKVWRPCEEVSITHLPGRFAMSVREDAPSAVVAANVHSANTSTNTQNNTTSTRPKQQNKKTTHHLSQGKQHHTSQGGQSKPTSWYNSNTGSQQNKYTNKYNSPRRNHPLVTNWAPGPNQCFKCCMRGHSADMCHSPPFCPYHGTRSHSWEVARHSRIRYNRHITYSDNGKPTAIF